MVISTPSFPQKPIWEHTYDHFEYGSGEYIVETPDNGYILAGTFIQGDSGRHLLLKTNKNGEIIWNKTFNNYRHHWDTSVQLTMDGGYIVGGGDVDGWLYKFDNPGNIVWHNAYGDENYQFGRYAIQAHDSGYVFTGAQSNDPVETLSTQKIWLVKTNLSGNLQWSKTYGDFGSASMGASLLQTNEGGYLVTGTISHENDQDSFASLIKTDTNGELEWIKKLRKVGFRCRGENSQKTPDNGFITVGRAADNYDPNTDQSFVYVIKSTSSGDTLWTRMYRKGVSSSSGSIQCLHNGDYLIAATYANKFKTTIIGRKIPDDLDVWIFIINPNGEIIWEETFGGPHNDGVFCIHENSDKSIVFTGYKGISKNERALWIAKLAEVNVAVKSELFSPSDLLLYSNYPNPFNLSTFITYSMRKNVHVTIKIYNIHGRFIKTLVNENKLAGEHSIRWHGRDRFGNNVSSGLYICEITGTGFRQSIKMVKLE